MFQINIHLLSNLPKTPLPQIKYTENIVLKVLSLYICVVEVIIIISLHVSSYLDFQYNDFLAADV